MIFHVIVIVQDCIGLKYYLNIPIEHSHKALQHLQYKRNPFMNTLQTACGMLQVSVGFVLEYGE